MSEKETRYRVLLVEDEPVIRELVRTMLASGSVEVDCASDATECLRLVHDKRYDLVLLDIVLPGMDGITICRLLRADPASTDAAIYMLTAKARATDVEAATRAGANGYISKPFRGAELIDLVDQLRKGPEPT